MRNTTILSYNQITLIIRQPLFQIYSLNRLFLINVIKMMESMIIVFCIEIMNLISVLRKMVHQNMNYSMHSTPVDI